MIPKYYHTNFNEFSFKVCDLKCEHLSTIRQDERKKNGLNGHVFDNYYCNKYNKKLYQYSNWSFSLIRLYECNN